MAADYTRTIVFKVEDQAIKRATNQIVTSLKRIETTLEKIHKKGFSKIAVDAGNIATGIDKATAALNKYNKELARAQKQQSLPAPKTLLPENAANTPANRRARAVRAVKGKIGTAMAGIGGISVAGLAAYSTAVQTMNVAMNNAISISPRLAHALGFIEKKTNALSIAKSTLIDAFQAHPTIGVGIAAAVIALGVDFKKTTTAAIWFKNTIDSIGKTRLGNGIAQGLNLIGQKARNLLLDLNPIERILGRMTGTGRLTSSSFKGFSGGARYSPIDSMFPIDANRRTIDVSPISTGQSSFESFYRDLSFTEQTMARGRDPRQKLGMRGRISANVGASRRSRAASGFADWEIDRKGIKTASARDTIMKSIERKNRRLVKQGKEKLKTERMINKEMQKQLGIEKKLGKMFTDKARRDRRREARIRLAGKKMGMNRLDSKGAESLMLGAGFPMLFGGGVGAVGGGVGGALLGNMMGMGGFGTQIIGSALGTQLELLHSRVVAIGNATQTLNLDKLEESGIRVNAQLELQINRLKKVGKFKEAEQLLDKKVFETTGGTGGVNKDIANNVAMLKNVWDGLLAAVGTTIGMVAAPFVTALAAILKIVSEIFRIVNAILSGVTWLIKKLVEGFIQILPNGEQILEGIEKRFENINGALDDMNMKFANWVDKMKEDQQLILDKITLGEKEALIQADIRAAVEEIGIEKKNQIETTVRALHATRDQYDEVKRVREAYKAMGTTIKDGIVDALEAAILKTKSLGDVARSVFSMMASQLLKMGVTSALTGVFGGTGFGKFLGLGSNKAADVIQSVPGIPGGLPSVPSIGMPGIPSYVPSGLGNLELKASGGPVSGGSPYVVGEKGPELFVPGSSGNIVPNHAMGGTNVVVNVDASGSAVQGDGGQAEELGSMLAAAVQAELVNQQRPGGLLAGTR